MATASGAGIGRPNVVIVMVDQMRADFTRAAGFPLDTMPFLDSLGARGQRFERAFTPMPICAPARVSLFTGRFPKAHRVRQNSAIKNAVFGQDLMQLLREAGYAVGLAGKNHSHIDVKALDFAATYAHHGHTQEAGPSPLTADEAAFDGWLTELNRDEGSVSLEPTPFPLECQNPVRIVRDALRYVDAREAEQPFFLWLSMPEPHNPYQVPAPYFDLFPADTIPERVGGPELLTQKTGPLGEKWRWEREMLESAQPGYDAQWRRYKSNYCGMLRLIDDQLKRFVEHLEVRGQLNNTIILFTADHGDYAGDYGLQRKGVGLPECLMRVPFVFAGAGVTARPSNHADHVSLVDVMPTLCEALGLEVPFGVQGRSLWPVLIGGAYPAEEFRSMFVELGFGGLHYGETERPPLHFAYGGPRLDELNTVTQSGTVKCVRMGRWKLTFDMLGNGELYDLGGDPAELKNLFDDAAHGETRARLTEELLRWTIRAEDDLPLAGYVPKRAERNWYTPARSQ